MRFDGFRPTDAAKSTSESCGQTRPEQKEVDEDNPEALWAKSPDSDCDYEQDHAHDRRRARLERWRRRRGRLAPTKRDQHLNREAIR